MSTSADVLIVGGGVMGTSIAFSLAQRRAGKVLLLEKSYLGAGSSGKSGAIVRQHYSTALSIAMSRLGLRVYEHFPDLVGGPPVFTHTGMVVIVHDRNRAGLEANLALQKSLGVTTKLISAQELTDLDPNARLADDELAAYESEAGYVESVQAVNSYADSARLAGADIRTGVEVQEILLEKDRVVGVLTNEGRYECRSLVLATGPWAARLAKQLRLELPVQPSRTQVALFRRPADSGRRGLVYGDFVQSVYFKPTHGDMIHAGSLAGEELYAPVDPDAYPEAADSDWLPDIKQRLSRRYPTMHRGYGRGGFGALYAITPDWHPIIDKLPGVEGVYCAVGFSGHGFKMAPCVGQLVAELVVDGACKTLDITPLRFSRFAEEDPVTLPYAYSQGVMG